MDEHLVEVCPDLYRLWDRDLSQWTIGLLAREKRLTREERTDLARDACDAAVVAAAANVPANPGGYMRRVTANYIARRLGRAAAGPLMVSLDSVPEAAVAADPAGDPARSWAVREFWNAVREATSRLPVKQRRLFRLLYENGLSVGEAAEVLGVPASTVSDRHIRALRGFRLRMQAIMRVQPYVVLAIRTLLGDGAIELLMGDGPLGVQRRRGTP